MKKLTKACALLLAASLALCSVAFASDAQTTPDLKQQQADAITLFKTQYATAVEELAASSKADPWVKEMLSLATIAEPVAGEPDKKGAIPITAAVTYPLLLSGVDKNSVYEPKEAEAFVRAALLNAMLQKEEYTLNATVAFPEGKDPAFKWHSSKGFSGLKTKLTSKAKAAVNSFSAKTLVAAMAQYVLRHPVRNAKLNLKEGPHAMALKATAPGYNKMLSRSLRDTLARVAYEAKGPNTEEDTVISLFDEQIAAYATIFGSAKKAATDQAIALSFDPWALINGKNVDINTAVLDYRYAYDSEYSAYRDGVVTLATTLPDAPALPQPETERLEGGRSGTKVVLRAKKGDGNIMVRFIKNDEVKALGFVRDGARLTLYLSQGEYIMQVGSGNIWYGSEELFGPDTIATYSYDRVTIPSKKYIYTLTLGFAENPDDKDIMDTLDKGDFR